jgi:hypothetical protein
MLFLSKNNYIAIFSYHIIFSTATFELCGHEDSLLATVKHKQKSYASPPPCDQLAAQGADYCRTPEAVVLDNCAKLYLSENSSRLESDFDSSLTCVGKVTTRNKRQVIDSGVSPPPTVVPFFSARARSHRHFMGLTTGFSGNIQGV